MTFDLNRVNDTRVEENIQPPMLMAITLPVTYEGMDIGVSIYVAVSLFAPRLHGSPVVLHRRLQEIASRVRLEKGAAR